MATEKPDWWPSFQKDQPFTLRVEGDVEGLAEALRAHGMSDEDVERIVKELKNGR